MDAEHMNPQHGILTELPSLARYQFFRLKPNTSPKPALTALAELAQKKDLVIGLGKSLIDALDASVPSMRKMPEFESKGIDIPTSPHALWVWIRGNDRGELLHTARMIRSTLASAFELDHLTDAFIFDDTRDLSGYEDGTENPEGNEAISAALMHSKTPGLQGSSFVAVQQWVHDLDGFESMSQLAQDHIIGRDKITNEELDEAPESAHVKRTAQEDFDPEAFVVRRSMPWANETQEGLVFVAFGKSFDAFEALMNRMIGVDDGIVDGLFSFSRPVTGSYFWCPPIHNGKLDLSYLF